MKKPVPRSTQQGFSLVEVLLVIAIFAVILLTLANALAMGYNTLSRTKQVTTASQIAQQEIEYIRNMAYDDISTYVAGSSDFIQENLGADQRYSGFDLTQLQNISGSLTLTDDLSDPVNMQKLTVTITWDYRGQQAKKNFVTYVLREGINKR